MARRTHSRGASYSDRDIRRLGAGRYGRDGVQLRDSYSDDDVAHHRRRSGATRHRRFAYFRCRWLARRAARGSLRPSTHSSTYDCVVRAFHVLERTNELLVATSFHARPARVGLRRRVGSGLGVDGRNDSRPPPRQSCGHRASRLGDRLGTRGALLCASVLVVGHQQLRGERCS